MAAAGIVSLVAVLGIWGTSLFAERKEGRSSVYAVRAARWAFFIAVLALVAAISYLSREQFLAWQGNEFSKYFLPPYQPIGYFLKYIFRHFWATYAVSGAVAIIAYGAFLWANRVRGNMLFEREELLFMASGVLFAGHPGYVAYVMLVAMAYVAASLAQLLITRKNERISFYRFWLPSAIIAIVARLYLARYGWYADLLI